MTAALAVCGVTGGTDICKFVESFGLYFKGAIRQARFNNRKDCAAHVSVSSGITDGTTNCANDGNNVACAYCDPQSLTRTTDGTITVHAANVCY